MKKAKCFKCDKVLKFNPGLGGHGDFVLDKRDKDDLDIFICGCPRTIKFKIDVDGSITKQQQMFFPMTKIDQLPKTKIDEDDTFYYLGGQLFGYQEKTYDEILKNNEKNTEKMQYTTLTFNKYTLDIIYTSYYYPHIYEEIYNQNYNFPKTKTFLKKSISKTPHKCRIIKNKI